MMPAGRYYVGDLCYVMTEAEWSEFCDLTIKGYDVLDGEFQFKDGRRFATYGTMYGDGLYRDQHGREYSVDAGLIGCIKVEDIRADKYSDISSLGAITDISVDFVTGGGRGIQGWDGTIQFGAIAIATGDVEYEESEY
jgi:hypothetical protein